MHEAQLELSVAESKIAAELRKRSEAMKGSAYVNDQL